MTNKVYALDHVVCAFDENGNAYRRKLSVGLKRGEFAVLECDDGSAAIVQVSMPERITVYDLKERKWVTALSPTDSAGKPLSLGWPIAAKDLPAALGFQRQAKVAA